jgi:hypothetical protein
MHWRYSSIGDDKSVRNYKTLRLIAILSATVLIAGLVVAVTTVTTLPITAEYADKDNIRRTTKKTLEIPA